MKNSIYVICDWASNYLQHDGKFNFSRYGAEKGVPMEFKTFDAAVEYLDEHFSDNDREDLYIEKNK